MPRVFLGLGSNAGNRRENLRLALRWLEPHCHIEAVSSLYRSTAVVLDGAQTAPDYLNAACAVATDLPPHDLLRFVKEIEHAIGRQDEESRTAKPPRVAWTAGLFGPVRLGKGVGGTTAA